MTVRELKDALPYNADDAEVMIAPPGCKYGAECMAATVLIRVDGEKSESVIITAASGTPVVTRKGQANE